MDMGRSMQAVARIRLEVITPSLVYLRGVSFFSSSIIIPQFVTAIHKIDFMLPVLVSIHVHQTANDRFLLDSRPFSSSTRSAFAPSPGHHQRLPGLHRSLFLGPKISPLASILPTHSLFGLRKSTFIPSLYHYQRTPEIQPITHQHNGALTGIRRHGRRRLSGDCVVCIRPEQCIGGTIINHESSCLAISAYYHRPNGDRAHLYHHTNQHRSTSHQRACWRHRQAHRCG